MDSHPSPDPIGNVEVSARLTFLEFVIEMQMASAMAAKPEGASLLALYRAGMMDRLARFQMAPGVSPEQGEEWLVNLMTIATRFFDRVEARRAEG